MKPLLILTALLLVGGQIGLAVLAPGLAPSVGHSFGAILPFMAFLALPAALGLLLAPRLADVKPSAGAFAAVAVTGLAMRLVWFGTPAPLEDDFYRYLWDGAVLAHGFDPYRYTPEAALSGDGVPPALHALAVEARDVVVRINFPDLTSIYPGYAQLAFALAYKLAPWSLEGLRGVFLAADMTAALLLVTLLRQLGRSTLWAALYWCNPLVVLAAIGTAHMDALLAPLLLGALLTSGRQQLVRAGALVGLAAGIKVWPVLLAPLLLRKAVADWRRGWAALALFAAVAGLGFAPLALHALTSESGLSVYASDWANNNAPYAWVAALFDHLWDEDDEVAVRLFRLALGALGAGVAIFLAVRPVSGLQHMLTRALAIAATLFYLSPTQFPWYALWFLPFAAAVQCWPLLLPSVTLAAYYAFFPFMAADDLDAFQQAIALLHAAPVWAWLAWQWGSRRRIVADGVPETYGISK